MIKDRPKSVEDRGGEVVDLTRMSYKPKRTNSSRAVTIVSKWN